MLHTCVATTDVDYTTTAALKALVLGATATSTVEDERFAQTIRMASRWADGYVGYPLGLASYQETVAGYGRRHLMLARTPVVAVSRVFPSTDTGSDPQLSSTEFRVEDRDAGLLSRDIGFAWTVPVQHELDPRPMAGDEFRPWLVDYVAGYTRDGRTTDSPHWSTEQGSTSTGRTLPEDVEQAVLLRAAGFYEANDDVVSERLGDLEVTYRSDRSDRAQKSTFEFLLDSYRRMV